MHRCVHRTFPNLSITQSTSETNVQRDSTEKLTLHNGFHDVQNAVIAQMGAETRCQVCSGLSFCAVCRVPHQRDFFGGSTSPAAGRKQAFWSAHHVPVRRGALHAPARGHLGWCGGLEISAESWVHNDSLLMTDEIFVLVLFR